MSTLWDGVRRIGLEADLDEMQIIGSRLFSVGVPVEADPEFKAFVFAAGVTHSLGNQSIDYQLRRNYDRWIQRFSPEHAVTPGSAELLLKKVRIAAIARVQAIAAIKPVDVPAGADAAANTLIRLESTFRGAMQLIRLGFAFEAEALIRLGLEQVAWAYAVAHLDAVTEIESTSSTRAISKLRETFPGAGHIYGRLSELSHLSPRTHHRFVSSEGDTVSIHIQQREAARESLFLLVVLLDALLGISEICFHKRGIARESVNDTGLRLSAGRPAVRLVEEFVSIFPDGAPQMFRKWWR